MDEEMLHVLTEHLEKLFHREFQKIHERFDCIERKYRRRYEKRDREKERENRRMKSEEQMKKHFANFEVFWENLLKTQEKEKLECEEKEKEKEIESVFVVTENTTILTTSSAHEVNFVSLSQSEVIEENKNSTFEIKQEGDKLKVKEQECMKKIIFQVEEKIQNKEGEERNENVVKEELLQWNLMYNFIHNDTCLTTNVNIFLSGSSILKEDDTPNLREVSQGFKRVVFEPGG